jgi:hypothetical protein
MIKSFLALAGAAVVMTAIPAAPANARHVRATVCTKWRHGHCIRSKTMVRRTAAVRPMRYRVGYRFGPTYGYTAYTAIPQTYVSRYNLSPNYRYVYNPGGPVYVVDPATYAITRVLNAL